MEIAIIGSGNVGGALAEGWAKAGHAIHLGVRNVKDFKGKELVDRYENITVHQVPDAVKFADTILIAATPKSVKFICESLGDVSGKVIIDAMNSVMDKPEPFSNTSDAILAWSNTNDVVKCFNTTGFENMKDPVYNGEGIDMFVAGDSPRGKEVAEKLAKELGFSRCYDFGGNDKFDLIEQFALCWINLAIFQKHGRDIAFKLIPQ